MNVEIAKVKTAYQRFTLVRVSRPTFDDNKMLGVVIAILAKTMNSEDLAVVPAGHDLISATNIKGPRHLLRLVAGMGQDIFSWHQFEIEENAQHWAKPYRVEATKNSEKIHATG